MILERGYVGEARERLAFLRRPGDPDAPVLFAFHQTPLSSWTYRPLLEHSRHPGDVIAFDSPGYGDSDPIAQGADRNDSPSLELFADRLSDAVATLAKGRRLVLLGQHTGAHLALMIGTRFADRTDAVIFQGLTLYTDEERADRAANYAPWFDPQPDGSHLTSIWQRISALYPRSDVALRDRMVRDYLAADPGYPYAYLAVFACDIRPVVEAFRATGVPSAVIIGADDLVAPRQDRVVAALGSESIMLDGLTDHAAWEDPARFTAAVDDWIMDQRR
jgi:pimeloyl-ACP methyl ester carboxylesterase